MPNFEVFSRSRSRVRKQPMIALQRRGDFTLNQGAFEALGMPKAVELLFDPKERIVGLRAVDPEAPTAYPVRKHTGASHVYAITGKGFVGQYGISTDASWRLPATLYGDVLGVTVPSEDAPPPPAHRAKRA